MAKIRKNNNIFIFILLYSIHSHPFPLLQMQLCSSFLRSGRQLWCVKYIPVGGVSPDCDLHNTHVSRHCPWTETGSHCFAGFKLTDPQERPSVAEHKIRDVHPPHHGTFCFGAEKWLKWVNWETLGTGCSSSVQCPVTGSLCTTSVALPWSLTILSHQCVMTKIAANWNLYQC